ncbi:MAG TPA: BRO family protein [Trebonia sp.]|jgi:prophage antirepressor-like protein|nr:BRO family protein [Trebonia sp.]
MAPTAPSANPNRTEIAVATGEQTRRFPATGQDVRIVHVYGEPWFVAADVCSVLGIRNSRDAIASLDDDERGVATTDTLGGPQNMTIVSEAGLYSLIMRSRRPEAREFKRWITHDVLPAIRRTGSYVVDSMTRRELAMLIIAEADRADVAEARAREMAPAAQAWEVLADSTGDYSLRDAGHILNRDPAISIGQNRLMRFLRDEGLVDRKGIPYVKYSRYLVERPVSYTHPHTGEPVLKSQVRITVDGLKYLRKRLSPIGREVV